MTKLRVCFVIPTYNEAPNIERMLRRLTTLDDAVEVLVVDDNSPDGTAALVDAFRAECPRVHLRTGEKKGLGAAYQRGIAAALNDLGADVVVQMDADFSHDPQDALRLIDEVEKGADVAIGSRYVPGGSVDQSWHFTRRWLSRGGNWLARHIAGIRGVRDCTSGFKAIRRSTLERSGLEQLAVKGYAFQIALLHRLLLADAKVVEIPIYFKDRTEGETKLGWRDLLEFFVSVWSLRFPSALTFTKFALTGLSGVVVNLFAFQMMMELGWHKYVASPVAIELSIVWNFFLNNYWTFRHREMIGRKRVRGVRFNTVSLLTLGLSFSTFFALSTAFPSGSPILFQALAILPAALINYFVNSYWTFREG